MLRLGIPKVKIAKDLGIACSTLYAEIKRSTARQIRSDWTYYDTSILPKLVKSFMSVIARTQ